MKKIILALATISFLFISCKDGKDMETTLDETANNIENTTDEIGDEIERKYDRATADSYVNDMEANVEVKDNDVVNIKGWTSYPNFSTQVISLSKTPAAKRMAASKTLRQSFNDFKNGIPSYLMIDDVQDAIEDVEKEIKEFETELADPKTKEKENAENIEEIQEAFADLRKEIVQARKKYVDNREDAIEEYLEELNDYDPNKTTAERLRDAREEYNEEINDK